MKKTIALMIGVALAASGTASHASGVLQAAPQKTEVQTLVFTGSDCLLTSDQRPAEVQGIFTVILGFLFPLAVEYAFDAVSEELTKVRKKSSKGDVEFHLWERKTASLSAETEEAYAALYGDQDVPEPILNSLEYRMPSCVTSITAEFTADQKSRVLESVARQSAVKADPAANDLRQRLADNGINPAKIHHVFEVRVAGSADRTSYRYVPVLAGVYEFIPGNRASKQGVVFAISLQGPGATPWGTTYSGASISLGEVRAGLVLDSRSDRQASLTRLGKLTTGELIYPGISDAAYHAVRRDHGEPVLIETADGNEVPLLDTLDREVREYQVNQFMPAKLQIEVTQTKKPGDAARVAAALLSKIKPKASSWVGGEFDEDAEFKAEQELQTAEIAYRKAEQALAGLNCDQTSSTACDIAKLERNKTREAWERLND